MTTSIRNGWTVANLWHFTTGETISPDEQTGDEWKVERRHPLHPRAVVTTTYAVTRRPVDEDGNFVDTCEIPDEDAHPHWRYAVDEVTELWIGEHPGEDVWDAEAWSRTEYGQGSYRDFETEVEADVECARMAHQDAAIPDAVTWDGEPFEDG